MGTVVVGLDGSDASRRAFAVALEEAALKGHGVRAVHVYAYPVSTIYQAVHIDISELEQAATAWLDHELADLQTAMGEAFAVPVDPVVAMGHAGVVLVEQAADADLLVVGSRGLGGLRGMFLGSISTYCSHHLPCPLLIVPAEAVAD